MRRLLSPSFLVVTSFALTPACGGSAVTSGGDGDSRGGDDGGDGSGPITRDGDTQGDGDVSGGTRGDGDVSGDGDGDGDSPAMVCEPGAVSLCDSMQADGLCTGIQTCAEAGATWGACLCPTGTGEGGSGTGGSAQGGAGGAGPVEEPTEPTCPDVMACGGDVVGPWEVRSSCLEMAGQLDVSPVGLGCRRADVSGELQVFGVLSLLEDGHIVDYTTTAGSVALGLAHQCLEIAGTAISCDQIGLPLASLGFASVQCLESPSGGCVCAGQVSQQGGLAYVASGAEMNVTYTVDEENLTVTGGQELTYSYCAQAESLVMTPTGGETFVPTRGTVVLERVR